MSNCRPRKTDDGTHVIHEVGYFVIFCRPEKIVPETDHDGKASEAHRSDTTNLPNPRQIGGPKKKGDEWCITREVGEHDG